MALANEKSPLAGGLSSENRRGGQFFGFVNMI